VQPGGARTEWNSDPFSPVLRDGRMYGRGTSDDKCGIVIHAGTARLLDGAAPVGIKVFIEGEEEIGSLHLTDFLVAHGDLLASDVIVISDSANWDVGAPALTTSLRGLVDCVVEVRTLDFGVHSGMFGGAVPDALSVLARALATLHDDRGRVAVPGLAGDDPGTIEYPENDLRTQAGMRPGVELIGDGSLASRLWSRPAIAVLAIDAPRLSEAINQVVPVARAKVSMRIAPGQDPAVAMDGLTRHLEAHVPWGAEVGVTPGAAAPAFRFDSSGPGHRAFRTGLQAAWGRESVDIGTGGSIPIVPALQSTFPGAEIVLTGAADPLSAAHGPNESVSLDELKRSTLAEAIALHVLAGD
jgi:acetylornithine deacetylase/succinyl-diaminopimelate desuccinylase-like protein